MSKAVPVAGAAFCVSRISPLRALCIRLPEELISNLYKQASLRGLPLSAYIRATLTNSQPVNIHQKSKTNASA